MPKVFKLNVPATFSLHERGKFAPVQDLRPVRGFTSLLVALLKWVFDLRLRPDQY